MRTATGLSLIAIGAILALAVTSQPSFINLHVAGFVIALTGVAGLLIPRRGYGWLRRRVTVRRGGRARVTQVEEPMPPYVALNPGAQGAPPDGPEPGDITAPPPGDTTNPIPVPRHGTAEGDEVAPRTTVPPPGATETIEEFIEE
jgi:hypothetical protein